MFTLGDSRSNSSHGSQENISNVPPHYPIPSIAVLSPNNSRPPDLLLPESTSKTSISNNNKREQETVDKVCKMVKLSQPNEHHEKENVDPKKLTATTVSVFIMHVKKKYSVCFWLVFK